MKEAASRGGLRYEVFGVRILRIDQQTEPCGFRQQLAQQPEVLCHQVAEQEAHAGRIAAGPRKARDQTELDGIVSNIDHAARRRGSRMAVRGARAATDAPNWRVDGAR